MARRTDWPSSGRTAQTEENTPTLRLGRFDQHGTTRARYGGTSIEVEHGIPGEVVRVGISGTRRPRGKILEIIEPAPERVKAPCIYFTEWSCGGCQWQHIDYEAQLERKRSIVDAAMAAARLELRVGDAHALADPWHYRATAGISLGKSAGFRRHGSLAIVPIRDCPISHPLISQFMADLNDALAAGSVADFRGRVRIEVRLARDVESEATLHAHIRPDWASAPVQSDLAALGTVLSSMPIVAGVCIKGGDGTLTRLSGPQFAAALVDGRRVWLSAASFFQTNLSLLPQLIGRLREVSSPLAGKYVADVFGGVGVLGLFLSMEAAEVIVVERDPVAVEAGKQTARDWDRRNVRFSTESADAALSDGRDFDVVIVDPPRSGLDERVLSALERRRPRTVLYVSCLAESLARDLRRLSTGGYTIQSLELFDFYPHTYHAELLAVCTAS